MTHEMYRPQGYLCDLDTIFEKHIFIPVKGKMTTKLYLLGTSYDPVQLK